MHAVELRVGQTLTLTPEPGGEEHPAKVLASEPDRLLVEVAGGPAWRPSPGARLRVSFAAEDGLRVFSTSVLEGGEAERLALEAPRVVERVQRRRFERYALQVKVACAPLGKEGEAAEGFEAQTLDIGGNGLVLVSGHPLSVGERVRLTMRLEGFGDFTAVGEVRRVGPSGEQARTHLAGFELVEVSEDHRAALLAYAHANGHPVMVLGWF